MRISHYHKDSTLPLPEDTPIFATPAWLEALYPGEWDIVLAIDRNQVVALWPYRLTRKWGFRLLVMPPLTPYLGPWCSAILSAGNTHEAIRLMAAALPRYHLLSQQVMPRQSIPEMPSGWQQEAYNTCMLDVRPDISILWKQCNENTKRNIRAGEKRLTIRAADTTDALWQLKKDSYQSKGKQPPPHKPYLERATAFIISNDKGCLLEAVSEQGEVAGAVLLVFDGKMAHYLYGAAHPVLGKGALFYLLWEAIHRTREGGLDYFNFEGSRVPGIARFFKGFGATEVNYLTLENHKSFLLRWWQSL